MNCPECKGTLTIRHTYVVLQSKTQDAECGTCYTRFTLLTEIVSKASKGKGAYALAQKLKKKAARPEGRAAE